MPPASSVFFLNCGNLLLAPQGTAASVIDVNEKGIVRVSELQLPPGYLIQSLLSSNGPFWTVSTSGNAKILDDTASGHAYPVFRTGPIFQFNSLDGSPVRRIDVPEGVVSSVLWENGGDFNALTTDKNYRPSRDSDWQRSPVVLRL